MKGLYIFGAVFPAKIYSDFTPFANRMRGRCCGRIPHDAHCDTLRIMANKRLQQSRRIACAATAWIVLCISQHYRFVHRLSNAHRFDNCFVWLHQRFSKIFLALDNHCRETVSGRLRRCLAVGMANHSRTAFVQIGGWKTGRITEIEDVITLARHRCIYDALRWFYQRALEI